MGKIFSEADFINSFDLPDIHMLGLPGYYICAQSAQYEQKRNFKGRYFKTSENHCRIIIGDETNRFCYRGENSIYPQFIPSLKRCKNKLEHCVEWIKTDQFKEAFKNTPYYKILPKQIKVMNKYNFEFDLEAIAQHYGFKTNYLDITRNREIAEFFAYTYVDEDGNYKPILDFNQYHPILYTACLDELIRNFPNNVIIVGFQAVLRPLLQEAMAINIDNIDANFKKQFFIDEELECNPIKAKEVFDKFRGGDDLFKQDAINTLEYQLKSPKCFLAISSVIRYCHKFEHKYSSIRIMLERNKYKILDSTLTPHPDLDKYMYELQWLIG